MPECCLWSLHLFFWQRLISHQEAGPGSPEDYEIPAALPTQVLIILSPAVFCPAISTTPPSRIFWSPLTPSLSLCRMRELKQNQELEGLPQPGLAT